MKRQLIFLVLIIAFYSCGKEKIEGKIKNNSTLAAELKASPETLIIGNNNLVLTTYIWRDFMPGTEENGSPLMCVSKLKDQDSTAISNSISLKKLYVVKDNQIWTADCSQINNSPEFILECYVNNGPKWGLELMLMLFVNSKSRDLNIKFWQNLK